MYKWYCVTKYYVGDVYLLYLGSGVKDTEISFPVTTRTLVKGIKFCMFGFGQYLQYFREHFIVAFFCNTTVIK